MTYQSVKKKKKEIFLRNTVNKQNIIRFLSEHQEKDGIIVIHANDDAGALIIDSVC